MATGKTVVDTHITSDEDPNVWVVFDRRFNFLRLLKGDAQMAESVFDNQVSQYQNTMRILCQQTKSKLEGTTIPPVKVEGEYLFWERIGPSVAIDIPGRHSDTPNIEIDHSRRRSTTTAKVWATLLDRADQGRMLVDPKGPYQETGRMAMARAKDAVIIAALGGSAWSGKTGTTEVILPATQKIGGAAAGLTISKILTTIEMFGLADVDEDIERYLLAAPQQKTNLLNTTEVTSADYNTVQALVAGKIDTFLGFKFIWSTLLTKVGTSRFCYAYTKQAIGYGNLEEITVKLTEESTKNFAWQPYISMDMGATRIEECQVVEIECIEV